MLCRLGLCVFDNEDIWSRIAGAREKGSNLRVDFETVWVLARAIIRAVINQRMLSRWVQWSGPVSTEALGAYTDEEIERRSPFDNELLNLFEERDNRNPIPTRPSMDASGVTPPAPPPVRPAPRTAATAGQGANQERWENLYRTGVYDTHRTRWHSGYEQSVDCQAEGSPKLGKPCGQDEICLYCCSEKQKKDIADMGYSLEKSAASLRIYINTVGWDMPSGCSFLTFVEQCRRNLYIRGPVQGACQHRRYIRGPRES